MADNGLYKTSVNTMNSIELCAGAGGQALGLERAGFEHQVLVEIDPHACATLRHNRPHWQVHEGDLTVFAARAYQGVDLVAGGVPCPPFSKAGKQLGADDERDLFPQAMRVAGPSGRSTGGCRPAKRACTWGM